MNKETYIYANGQIIVDTDTKENKKVFREYEGFEEILSQENLVEKLENAISSYKKEILELEEFSDVETKKFSITLISMSFVSIMNLVLGMFLRMPSLDILLLIYSSFCLCYSGKYILKYLKNLKRQKAMKESLIFLEESLKEEQVYLEELKEEEKKYLELRCEITSGKIPSIEEKVNYYVDRCSFYYDYTYNQKKYILLYKSGLLRKKSEKKYTEYGFDALEKCAGADALREEDSYIRELAIKTIGKFIK